LGGILALALVYVTTAKLGLAVAVPGTNATPVWAPTGVSLAVLVLFGVRFWPGVALGAFLANVDTSIPWVAVVGITVGNTLEALAGTCLLARAGFQIGLRRVRDVVSLAVMAGVVSTLVSAVFGVASLRFGGAISSDAVVHVFRVWWLGDMTGDLVVAAGILVFASRPRLPDSRAAWVEAVVLLGSLAVVVEFAVGAHAPWAFLVFPWAIYAAVRFRQAGAVAASGVIFTVATWNVVRGHGLFAQPHTPDGLVLSQVFVGVNALVMLVLAAVTGEREEAREAALRAVERVSRLQELSAQLGRSDTVHAVAATLVERGVPACGAQAGWVALIDEDGSAAKLAAQTGYEALATPEDRGPSGWRKAARRVIRTDRPYWPEDRGGDERRVGVVDGAPGTDGMVGVLPLRCSGEPVGALGVSFAAPGGIDNEERRLLVGIADQAGQALERARLSEREHRLAESAQRSLLPDALPSQPGVQLAARYLPASAAVGVGGDWYDTLELADGRLLLAVGDVVGHGLEAAEAMGRLRVAVLAYALEDPTPAALLERLSHLIDQTQPGNLTTLCVALVDPLTRRLDVACAGHPPPLIVAAGHPAAYIWEGRGVPLGSGPPTPYEQVTLDLDADTSIVLFTDGLIERRDRAIHDGLAALAATVDEGEEPSALCDRILSSLMGDVEQQDDVALVVCRLVAVPALDLWVPAEPASLARVRRALAAFLSTHRVDTTDAWEFQVACGEACANAIEHAYQPGEAHYRVEATNDHDTVNITVTDDGDWREARGQHRGHGQLLMQELMDEVETDHTTNGTTVHLSRRVAVGAPTP
jgi:serine phosphatase RsbU (regulator of sigma subunit)/integral membrane sensor domain MASE1/anti-sigma regulatory factor (Ser/Thr protein kinase)